MRVFIAAELSADVVAAAAAAGAELRRRLERADAADGIRWIPPANMHLTVWFLGEVSEPRVAAILQALSPPLPMPAFDVHVAGFGVFPPSGAPRVIWMGVTRGLAELSHAHDLLTERLVPWGFAPDVRAYSAHLTLARIKDGRGDGRGDRRGARRGPARKALRDAIALQRDAAGQCRIAELTVFHSRTEATGAIYEPLLRVPLE
jgi:2'-5' RNA ligase